MRVFVPFALALAGTGAFTADASAFCWRRAASSATNSAPSGGCHGSGYATPSYGGCYGSGYATSSYGGCYGSGYTTSSAGGCYGSGYSTSSYGGGYGRGYVSNGYSYTGSVAYSSPVWSSGSVVYSAPYSGGTYATSRSVLLAGNGGRAGTIQATDGAYYTLGSDGIYYPAYSNGTTILNGVTTQPYNGGTVSSRSSYSPAASTVTTNGSGVVLASGTALVPTSTVRAKQVLGTQVLIQNNTQVGTVEDLVSDGAGNLDYIVVSTGDNKLVTVPWDAAKFDPEKKTATVNVSQDVWRTVPTYTATTYPQFYTPTYRTDTYKVYGLTPRELRRIP